jgi:hypothetical protein
MKMHYLTESLPGMRLFRRRVLVGAVMGVVALQGRASPGEPESKGHPLSYWLEQDVRSNDSDERAVDEAAIREIGTNGLPAMLVWLHYDPTQSEGDTAAFLAQMQQFAAGRWVPPQLKYDQGVPPGYIGFQVLGPAAAPAVPELAKIANDARQPRPAIRALMALSAIGPAALPAVEARLANTNFPFPPDAAVRMYLRTRTSMDEHQVSIPDARAILIELKTNTNPLLATGASQMLNLMDLPSTQQRGQTKSFSEALLDRRTERQHGTDLKPGWNIPPWARLSPAEQLAASNAVRLALTTPPVRPKGDESYPYPLQPGTPEWNYATVEERLQSIKIPKSWRAHATSWQLFRSAIGCPYFRGIYVSGYDIDGSYQASRLSTVSILQEVDTAPGFGTNVLHWLTELDLAKVAASNCENPSEPCFMDYRVVWHMASLDPALETLDVASRQRLYRLAIWDTDYFLSRSNEMSASGPFEVIYALARKPESFRGILPAQAILLSPTPDNSSASVQVPELPAGALNVQRSVAAAKAALELKQRP